MLRISQLDWPRILFTRPAAILLGIAAVLSVNVLIFWHSNLSRDTLSSTWDAVLGVVGVTGVIGFILLLGCMALFWLKCDVSSKLNRTIWFVILLLGFTYGTQIAYYAIVYLPQVLRKLRNPEDEGSVDAPAQPIENHKRFGPFSSTLFIGWGLFALLAAAAMFLPKAANSHWGLVAIGFFVASAAVAIEAVIHTIVSVYRSGVSRPSRSKQTDSSLTKHHDSSNQN